MVYFEILIILYILFIKKNTMVLYHINSPYYRQFLTTKVKDEKKGKN